MTHRIHDEDTDTLGGISGELEKEYSTTEAQGWAGSPFHWILLRRSSRQRGKIGEQLVERYLRGRGLDVERSPDSDADRVVSGKRVEIKFSSLWEGGNYLFQQIRDQDYEYLICIGISPLRAHAWIIKKSDIPFKEIRNQHAGKKGKDTWWISFKPDSPPAWLKGNGTLSDVYDALAG